MAKSEDDFSLRTADVHSVVAGVSIPWLMKAFRMGRGKVERRLRGIAPVGQGKHNTPLYDLPEAAACLVKPRIDLEEYIKEMGPDALPEQLRDAYWSAMLKKQRWQEKAGELWPTAKVLERLSEVLQDMRVKLQLIPDSVERQVGLTAEQRRIVTEIADSVQDEMYQVILRFAESGETPNQLGEHEEETGEQSRREHDYEDFI